MKVLPVIFFNLHSSPYYKLPRSWTLRLGTGAEYASAQPRGKEANQLLISINLFTKSTKRKKIFFNIFLKKCLTTFCLSSIIKLTSGMRH